MMRKYIILVLLVVPVYLYAGECDEPVEDGETMLAVVEECFTDECVGCVNDCLESAIN